MSTWTYDTALTASKDKVRLMCGDTDTNDQKIYDEEINYSLTLYTNLFRAAAFCCRSIAGKYASQADASVSSIRETSSQRFDHYIKLAAKYEQMANLNVTDANIWIAGISESEMDSVREDDDRVANKFEMNMFNNRGTNLMNEQLMNQ